MGHRNDGHMRLQLGEELAPAACHCPSGQTSPALA